MNFFKKHYVWLLVIVIVSSGFGWYRSAINAAEARGEVKELVRLADSTNQEFQDSILVWIPRDSARMSVIQGLSDDLEAQSTAARVQGEEALETILGAQTTISGLRDSLGTLTAADLDQIEAGIDSLVEANTSCLVALGTCDVLSDSMQVALFDIRTHLDRSILVNTQQTVVIDRLQAIRHPKMSTAGYAGWGVAVVEAVVLILQALSGGGN